MFKTLYLMKILLRYILILIIFFSVCEFFSYLFFPKFRENLIFYQKEIPYIKVSKGINHYFNRLDEFLIRVKNYKDPVVIKNSKNIWFLGDSVSAGYGEKFEDIYYNVLSKSLEEKGKKFNIIPIASYGNSSTDLANNLNKIKKYIKSNDIIIYQFNYNDIVDINRSDINIETRKHKVKDNLLTNIIHSTSKFRYKYLNHSVFLKVLQHYAGIFARKTNGTCAERKFDALGPFYTYSFFAEGFEDKSEKLWNNFKENILEMKNIATTLDVKFALLIVPTSLQLKNHFKTNKLNYDLNCSTKNPHKFLIDILSNENIDYIDPLNDFINYDQKYYNLFHLYDTNHPNKKGHKILAETIYDFFDDKKFN